jgi:hypothetical protein
VPSRMIRAGANKPGPPRGKLVDTRPISEWWAAQGPTTDNAAGTEVRESLKRTGVIRLSEWVGYMDAVIAANSNLLACLVLDVYNHHACYPTPDGVGD